MSEDCKTSCTCTIKREWRRVGAELGKLGGDEGEIVAHAGDAEACRADVGAALTTLRTAAAAETWPQRTAWIEAVTKAPAKMPGMFPSKQGPPLWSKSQLE